MFLARMGEHYRGVQGTGWTRFGLRERWDGELGRGADRADFVDACRCVGGGVRGAGTSRLAHHLSGNELAPPRGSLPSCS